MKKLCITSSVIGSGILYGAYRYRPPVSYASIEEQKVQRIRHSEESADSLMSILFRVPAQFIACTVAELVGRFFLWRSTVIIDEESAARFRFHLSDRENHVGLLTVSNHISTLDDPFMLCGLTPFFSEKRWNMCAEEVCHKNLICNCIAGAGNTVPVIRGAGIHQYAVDTLIHKLNNGKWVHLFPEGRIWQKNIHSMDIGYTTQSGRHSPCQRPLAPLKWGVGKIIADAKVPIVVLPFFHTGMDEAMPLNSKGKSATFIPRIGKNIHIVVGEPLQFNDLISAYCEDITKLKDTYTYGNANDQLVRSKNVYGTLYPLPQLPPNATLEQKTYLRTLILYAQITDRIEENLTELSKLLHKN